MNRIIILILIFMLSVTVAGAANYTCWKGLNGTEKEGLYGTMQTGGFVPDAVKVLCGEYQAWVSVQPTPIQDEEKVVAKRDLQTNYQNQIENLNTVINNSNYIQTKTNWTNADIVSYMKVLAWHDKILAKGEIVILKILRWMLW